MYSYRMIALVCTAVQEEVLGVRCKRMLQFLQKAQGRIDTESGRSDHFDFLNAKFGVPAEEVEGVLTCRIAAAGGGLAVSCGGQPADIFDDVPSVSGSEDPPARLAAAAAAAAVMCIAHVLLQRGRSRARTVRTGPAELLRVPK